MPGGKKTHHQRKNLGYTIIEVMIVLAVSGVMFAIAASFINGKQERTAFPQGVNELSSRLQGVISDVTDGKYSDVPITCTSGAVVNVNTDVSGVDTQGRKADCIFRGKIVHFYGSNPGQYELIPLVDLRSSTASATDLAHINSNPSLVQNEIIPQHLDIQNAKVTANDGTVFNNLSNIGFVQSLGTLEGVDGYKSGSQTINLVYAAAQNMSGQATVKPIGTVAYAKSFRMCVTDGSRYATIEVGGNSSNKLAVTTTMRGTDSSLC